MPFLFCLTLEFFIYMFLQAMGSAGEKFIGEHDFRNFCKMDAVNVHNYRRRVTSFAISPSDVRLTLLVDIYSTIFAVVESLLFSIYNHHINKHVMSI